MVLVATQETRPTVFLSIVGKLEVRPMDVFLRRRSDHYPVPRTPITRMKANRRYPEKILNLFRHLML